MVLLHGFIKKSGKTPLGELIRRNNDWQACVRGKVMKKQHVCSNFDDFLREEQLLDVAQATAVNRVIAFQIAQEMKRRKLTKS